MQSQKSDTTVAAAPASPRPVSFRAQIDAIAERHVPSRHPFFGRLAALPARIARDPEVLGRLHLAYQAAMHATRAMVYHLPHLDAPALRIRKLGIFIDDDGLAGGDTHHYQLTRAFRNMGARLILDDEAFGDLGVLCRHLDPGTARFVKLVEVLYPRSLGPWCIVETLSDDWMRALAAGLAVHFPAVTAEPYFHDCFAGAVEERHAAESLETTELVLARRPELLAPTLRDARAMAAALDGVWTSLDEMIRVAARGAA